MDIDGAHHRLYGDLSWTWPIISPPEEYADETEEIIGFIEKYARIDIRRVLNLGSGGGHNDYTLKGNFSITGVDLSHKMQELARRLNPEVDYKIGDMRSVELGESFDAVTIFDSINYMLSVDDLRSVFATAYNHLRPGGVVATYIEEWAEKFAQNKVAHLTRRKGDFEITLVENYYDPDPDDTWYENTMIYLIRRSGELKIETDYHRLGLFPIDTFESVMKEVGFEACRLPSTITSGAGEDCPILIGVRG